MDTVIKNYLEQMKVGRKQSYKNLALYPLLSTYSVGLEYLMLDEALNENLIEIVEKDDGGSVPELRVMNKSSRMILILDGEELVGAKQNRIVNTTILVIHVSIFSRTDDQDRNNPDSRIERFSSRRRNRRA